MSYSIVFPKTATVALSTLVPQGVSVEDATDKLTSILKTDLGRIKFVPSKSKEGSKPKRLKFVKSKEKDDEGNPLRLAKYTSSLEGDASVAPQRSQDLYDFLWDLYEFEDVTGIHADNGHSLQFPRHIAEYVRKCLAPMTPRKEVAETKEAVAA